MVTFPGGFRIPKAAENTRISIKNINSTCNCAGISRKAKAKYLQTPINGRLKRGESASIEAI
jgi:hypothetical protein